MSAPLIAALKRLLEADGASVALSQFTASQRKALDEFQQRTYAIQGVSRGRGVSYKVLNLALVEQHLKNLSPAYSLGGLEQTPLPTRALNLTLTRSTKGKDAKHELYYALLRSSGTAIWTNKLGQDFDLFESTKTFGAQAFQLSDLVSFGWKTSGELWLVENQAVFDDLSWLPKFDNISVLWYRGNLTNILLDWLAKEKPAAKIVLFADYDGVGLQNYVRLLAKVPQAEFWLMPNWRKKLSTFSNNQIWQDNLAVFEQAAQDLLSRNSVENLPELRDLIGLMRQVGGSLEQEAVFIK